MKCIISCFLVIAIASTAYGMQCKLVDNGFLGEVERAVASCPPILFPPNSDLQYCCYNTKGEFHCCDLTEFAINVSLWVLPFLLIAFLISSFISCICCLCCPCCFLYKRRHGRVYRREPTVPAYTDNTTAPIAAPNTYIVQHTSNTTPQRHLPPGAFPIYPQLSGVNTALKNQVENKVPFEYSRQPPYNTNY